MPMNAVSFSERRAPVILAMNYRFQMVRIYAKRRETEMIYLETFGNRAFMELVTYSVSRRAFTVKPHVSVVVV